MKYDKKLVRRMEEEFKKTPNIRYVCAKVGIDHSTLYRWMSKHHTFYKIITSALAIGRDRISDAAEGVIISGIQNNDRKSATYWLAHNNPRYSGPKQAKYLEGINDNLIKIMEEPTPENSEGSFETLFEHYYMCEKVFGPEKGKKRIESLVKVMCHGDSALEDIFYITYQEWRDDRDELERKKEEAQPRKEQP